MILLWISANKLLTYLLHTASPALPSKPLSTIVLSDADVVGALQFMKQRLRKARAESE